MGEKAVVYTHGGGLCGTEEEWAAAPGIRTETRVYPAEWENADSASHRLLRSPLPDVLEKATQ